MKTITKTLITLFAGILLLTVQPRKAQACIDSATTVFVIVHYDTINFTDISLTVTNLRLFGGSPNHFCSCAINNYTDMFSNILYVAFVDSGTSNPVPGFEPYEANVNATTAWENVWPTGDWNAFVSEVNVNGLTPGNPVELVIRAQLPPGYTFDSIDSTLTYTYLGTDEWSNTNQDLADSHQNLVDFNSGHQMIAEHSATYFTNLDNALNTGIQTLEQTSFSLHPNPATETLTVQTAATGIQHYTLTDVSGKQLLNGTFSNTRTLDLRILPKGIYLLSIQNNKGEVSRKFVKQ